MLRHCNSQTITPNVVFLMNMSFTDYTPRRVRKSKQHETPEISDVSQEKSGPKNGMGTLME